MIAWFGPVLGTAAMRKDILERLRQGDPTAIDDLGMVLPSTLAPRSVIAIRDREIRALAVWLRSLSPTLSNRRIASIIAAAGDSAVARRRISDRPPFTGFDSAERTELEKRVARIVWLVEKWPGRATIRAVLGG